MTADGAEIGILVPHCAAYGAVFAVVFVDRFGRGLGRFFGFQGGYLYWLCCWVGNVAIAVAITGLALSLIDMSIKPLLQLLSLPITCLTFGIFYLVVNTAMLYLAAWLSNGMFHVGFYISSFGSAFFAAIVISIVSAIMNSIVADN